MSSRCQSQLTAICLMCTLLALNACTRTRPAKTVPPPPAQKPGPPEASTGLTVGKLIERELKTGERHTYPVTLKNQEYLSLELNQKGIEVNVSLSGPDGKQLEEVNLSFEVLPESLDFVSALAGTYQLGIVPGKKTGQAGRYGVKVAALRPATPEDRAKVEVKQLLAEGKKLQQAGQYQAALPFNEKAMALAEKSLGPEHPTTLDAGTELALSFYYQGNYGRAESLYAQALVAQEKNLGPDHPKTAFLLSSLALLAYTMGNYGRAEPLWLRAREIYEKTLGLEHRITADALSSLAELYRVKGDYARAEPLFLQALATKEKWLGPEDPEIGRLLGNLARLYDARGDDANSEPLLKRSLAIFEKTLGMEHPYTAIAAGNLARVYDANNDLARAEPLYERALAIFEKTMGPEHSYTATALHNLAHVYQTRQDYARAEPLFVKALAIYEKTLGPEHPYTALSLSYLAYLYRVKGDYARAEPLYQKALAIQEKVLGLNHPATATSILSLAVLYNCKGDSAQAVAYQIKGNDTQERDLVRNLVSGSEQQKRLYLKKTEDDWDRTLSLQVQDAPVNAAAPKMALEMVFRRKGRALDAMTNAIAVLRSRGETETQKLLDEYASINAQLSNLILKGPGQQTPEAHQAQIQALEAHRNQLEHTISARSAEFRVQTAPITLEGIQNAIPENAALIEYAAYRPVTPQTGKFGRPQYVAYVLKSSKSGATRPTDPTDQPDLRIQWVDLGPAEPIEQAVAAFRNVLRDRKSDLRLDVKTRARTLEKLVMQPVRKLLGTTKRLLLSPDGVLNLIPFDALVDERGQFLVQSYEISYLTSGRDLLRLRNGIRDQTGPWVLADPDYGDGQGPQVFGQVLPPLQRLAGTLEEASSIQTEFPQARIELKSSATEQQLKSVQRPLLLHIATHGYFFSDAPSQSDPEEKRQLTPVAAARLNLAQLKQARPLLQSMLFLAGANMGQSGTDDGVLTALEAAGLDLWGTKLVVLSACDTGLGEIKTGDGVYGLRRAFVLAGSETQMMSLWPISDLGTRDLMIEYYHRLKAGEGRSAGLRRIRLEFLNHPRWRHPYYWASFIQSGEWANLDGKR